MIRIRFLTSDERKKLKIERATTWHKWFAWYPVRLTGDIHEVRWLGFLYRKGTEEWDVDGCTHWSWKYAETELDILKYKL